MKVGIVGCGYVGLGLVANFGSKGFLCVGYDINDEKISKLQKGIISFYDDGFEKCFKDIYNSNLLSFTSTDIKLVQSCDVICFSINTPCDELGRCNTTYLTDAIKKVCTNIDKPTVIIIKSTLEVGTTRNIVNSFNNKNLHFIFSPEFLAQGELLSSSLCPSRIVFGMSENDNFSKQVLTKIYEKEMVNNIPIIFTSYETAELSKYASNCFLASKISFINLISQACESVNANISDIEEIMKLDKRIGKYYLSSGIGFGGSCFEKDLRAFSTILNDHHLSSTYIDEVLVINDKQTDCACDIIDNNCSNKDILVLGSTFKKNTSDTCKSPSIKVMEKLIKRGYNIELYDVVSVDLSIHNLPNIKKCKNINNALKKYNNIMIGSDWEEFSFLNDYSFKKPVTIFDFKRILMPSINNAKIIYIGK